MKKLKLLRQQRGLTLKQLASVLNVSDSTVSLWETGKRQPDSSTLIKLSGFFDVSIDYLLGNTRPAAKTLDEIISESEKLSERSKQDLIEFIEILKLKDQKLNEVKQSLFSEP